ncbi:hypothetical protein KAR91_37835 [Candidatus Pacearchaeota archaeon]|nr:hypothetical protein [Candidatus Pacearchaeota archaeon]
MSDLNVNSPEQKAKTITIKKNTIILNVLRSDLVEVKESGDGVIFSLKGGMDLSVVDLRMPLEVKRAVKIGIDKFDKNDIIIDLMNYVNPVLVQV